MQKAFLQASILFLLLAAPVGVYIARRAGDDVPRKTDEAAPVGAISSVLEGNGAEAVPLPNNQPVDDSGDNRFARWEEQLSETTSRESPFQRLQAWRAELAALPRDEAVRLLRAYWSSGRDHPTGLPFAPGRGGALRGAPSLRAAVLDLLGQWAPGVAYALAADALEGPKASAAEYALHLRNFAWGAPDSMEDAVIRRYLGEKALELVRHSPWQSDPSSGYQEAFDVLVWAEAVEAVPILASLMAADQPHSLVQPAGLTLDRLTLNAPAKVLKALLRNPSLLADRPRAEAGYFARADPADSDQRALLERYFLADGRTADTRDYLLSMLPNLNLRLSHNLLSENRTFSHEEVVTQLRATREMFEKWAGDPRFSPWRTEIGRASARLDRVLGDD